MMGFVSEDPEADWAAVSAAVGRQYDSYNRHAVIGTEIPLPAPVDPDRWRVGHDDRPPRFLYETPDAMAAQLRERFAGMPADWVLFWARPGDLDEAATHRHVAALARLQELLATSTEVPA